MTEVIGWLSSLILLVTVGKQIYKQWKTHTSEGVSKWLFLGQISASIGFTIYSALLHNWIFIVTNSLMLVSAFVGVAITLHHQRRE
jgi:MtN3 and saliva related transmembrane protein